MSKKANLLFVLFFLLAFVFVYTVTAANSITHPDSRGMVGKFSSLALDANGYPVISYYQEWKEIPLDPGPGTVITEHDLKIMHCNDPFCSGGDESITTPDSVGDVGTYTSLALDASGYPVVSYFDMGNGALKLMHCNDPNCEGDDESIVTADARRGAGAWSVLALDSDGYPVVAYEADGFLRVMHCNDPNCEGGDELFGTPDLDGGEFNSLQLDEMGFPVISYRGAQGQRFKLMHCNDPVCTGPVESITFPGIDKKSAGTSMKLDADGFPVVGFIWKSGQYLLHCNDPKCTGDDESITGPFLTPVGSNISLALDADGNPVVSTWVLNDIDGSVGRLAVLRCNDPYCDGIGESITTPDTRGNSGQYSSLVIDENGFPAISYYGNSYTNLKVIRCDTPTCAPAVEPLAMFAVEPPEGKAPKTVLFKQQSTGDFDNCVWTFGDGTSAEGCADQVHTYETPGEYTPRLVLSGWAGTDGYRCRGCVDIYEQVEADFSLAPEVGPAPLTVDFTNLSTGTFDTCTWEFGDGQSSSNCSGVTHVYTDKGRYTVKLTVSGDGGLAVKRVQSAVHAQDPAEEPVADFSVDPAVGPAPLLVSFTNLSTGTYDTCSWDFGDGESSSSCNGVTHVYNDLGTHTVSLIVSGAGGVDIKTVPNAVEVQAKVEEPVADFSALTRRGKPPLTVKFQDESAGTYDECTWDFGDGSRKGKGASPTHTYKRVGRYTVTMTASGSAGSDTVKKVDFVVVDPYLSFIPGVIAR